MVRVSYLTKVPSFILIYVLTDVKCDLFISKFKIGSGNYESVGHILQMALILSFATAIFPIALIWSYSESILIFFGQDPEVATQAAPYLQILIPSIFAFSTRSCIQCWCQAQQIVKPFAVNGAIVAIVSVVLTKLFVQRMDYLGGALAIVSVMGIQALLDLSYVYISGRTVNMLVIALLEHD